jgi:hypothetical protein
MFCVLRLSVVYGDMENENLIAQQWYTCICYFWKLVGLVQSGDSYQPIDIAEKLLIWD